MRKLSPGFADWMPNSDVREVAASGRGAKIFQSKTKLRGLRLCFWTLSIFLFLKQCFGHCILSPSPDKSLPSWAQSSDIRTSSIDWAQLSKVFPEDGDRIPSPKCCDLNKKWTVDNVQKHDNFINIPSAQILI
jgi:hypothetical protein